MRAAVSILLLAACGAGCGGDDDVVVPDATPCSGDDIAVDLTKTGAAGASVTLVALEPDPPARFTNAWTITARTPAGDAATVDDVTVAPFMPAHGHGPTVPPVVTDAGGGKIELAPLDLWMPGLWEVRIDVATDRVTFGACVPE